MRIFVVALLLMFALAASAQGSLMRAQEPRTLGVSCATVRTAVKSFTREHLEKLASAYGVTPAQRREAMACLRRSRSAEQEQ